MPNFVKGTWKYEKWASDSDDNTCICEMGLSSISAEGAILTNHYNSEGISDQELEDTGKLMARSKDMVELLQALLFAIEEGSDNCDTCEGVNVMVKDLPVDQIKSILKEVGVKPY